MIQILRPAAVTLPIVLVSWAAGRIFFPHIRGTRELVVLSALLYAALLVALVVVPVPLTRNRGAASVPNNFIPLHGIVRSIIDVSGAHKYMMGHAVTNIVGNIILFVPAGALLPACVPRLNTLRRTVAAAAMLSITIELAQLLSRQLGVYRSVDVDDVILNTIGAAIGFLLYRLLYRLFQPAPTPANPA